jgi:hypothetical protein
LQIGIDIDIGIGCLFIRVALLVKTLRRPQGDLEKASRRSREGLKEISRRPQGDLKKTSPQRTSPQRTF